MQISLILSIFSKDLCCIAKYWNSDRIKIVIGNVCLMYLLKSIIGCRGNYFESITHSRKVKGESWSREKILRVFFCPFGFRFLSSYRYEATNFLFLKFPCFRKWRARVLKNEWTYRLETEYTFIKLFKKDVPTKFYKSFLSIFFCPIAFFF